MARKHAWIGSTLPLFLVFVTAQTAAAQRSSLVERDVLRHSDLRALADDAEKLSDSFKNHLDRELDRSEEHTSELQSR